MFFIFLLFSYQTHATCLDRAFVCEDYVHSPKELDKEITRIQFQALNQIGFKDMADFSIYKNKHPEKKWETSLLLFDTIEQLTLKKINMTSADLKIMEDEVKLSLNKAIAKQNKITSEQKDFLQKIINNVQFSRVKDYLSADPSHLKFFERSCGLHGLQDNATAIAEPASVYFCPGKFLAAFYRSKDNFSAYLWRTLAHELGHHIDWFRFSFWFDDFKSCLMKNYVTEISSEPTENRMREVTADYWASEALGQHISHLAEAGTSFIALKSMIKNSYTSFCGLFPSAYHPPAPFRIYHGLLEPSLNEVLQCKRKEAYCKM